METRNGAQRITVSLPSRLDMLSVVDKVVEGVTATMQFAEDDRDAVAISVIEASSNAIQHGNRENRNFELIFDIRGDTLVVTVHDKGDGFNPAEKGAVEAPDLQAERGRGIFIMRSMMDEVSFDFSDGTFVQLTKLRSPEEDA